VLCCLNSEFTKTINTITYKTNKNTNIFVYDFIDFACEFTVKQQSTQLPAMRAVISQERTEWNEKQDHKKAEKMK
jgi:hypothetical protein